jgi:hypothetical protein
MPNYTQWDNECRHVYHQLLLRKLGKFHIYLYRWDTSFEMFSVGGGITRGPDISHMALQTSRTMFRTVLNLNRKLNEWKRIACCQIPATKRVRILYL